GPNRDERAAFIQPLFEAERATVAQHIRTALAGSGQLVSLAPPELPSTELDEVGTTETVALRRSSTPALPPPEPSRRSLGRRIVRLAAAAVVVVGADLAVWRLWRDGDPPPAPRVTTATVPVEHPVTAAPVQADLQLCGSNTVGAELAPALVQAFLE